MKIFKLILLINFITIYVYSQSAQGNWLDISIVKPPIDKIKSDINIAYKQWLEKKEFESISEYNKRVNNYTRKNKEIELIKKACYKFSIEPFRRCIRISDAEYDKDNETFKITLHAFPTIYVKVPSIKAESFKMNINNILYNDIEFALNQNNEIFISKATLINKNYSDHYSYNYKEPVTFKKYIIETNNIISLADDGAYLNVSVDDSVINIGGSDIDKDLPKTGMKNPNAFAVIIGNRTYNEIANVDYATNDAYSIKKYLMEVLGYKEGNIIHIENAQLTDFLTTFGTKDNYKGKLYNLIKPQVSDLFVYYSGHGAPSIQTKEAYFLPVDCKPDYIEISAYPRDLLIDNIAKLNAKSVTIIIDACFSGENIIKGISSTILEVSNPIFKIENGVLITSSSGSEVSCWYDEKQHGLFTYYFLKAIHDYENSDLNKDGMLTYLEIFNYLSNNNIGVPYLARLRNNKKQTPSILGNAYNKAFIEF